MLRLRRKYDTKTAAPFFLGLLLLAASLGVGFGSTHNAEGTFPGTNGKIAYIIEGQSKIFFINSDGTGPEEAAIPSSQNNNQLTTTSQGLHVSPDATKVLYVGRIETIDPKGNPQICDSVYVINRDGTGNTRLTDCANFAGFSWSPDGTRIVYATADGQIWLMNADGSSNRQLTNDVILVSKGSPSWSPDGTKIAFHAFSQVDFAWNIFVMNVDGTGITQITHNTRDQFQFPNWSPDGTKVVFDGSSGIWTVNSDGTGLTSLSTQGGRFPTWSPDGTKVVFTMFSDGLATVNSDGTGLTLVGSSTANGNFPDWGTAPPRYKIPGFYQPVDNSPTINIAKAGSVIPIRFELFNGIGSIEYTDASAIKYQIGQVQCPSSAATDAIETTTTGTTSLQYDGQAGQYLLKWQTPKETSPKNCV